MMGIVKIHVTYAAVLKIDHVRSGSHVNVDDGTTVAGFLTLCGVQERHQRSIVPLVNGVSRRLDYALQDGDSLNLLLPVGGG
jgi:sulfur carrier protein ThiS